MQPATPWLNIARTKINLLIAGGIVIGQTGRKFKNSYVEKSVLICFVVSFDLHEIYPSVKAEIKISVHTSQRTPKM